MYMFFNVLKAFSLLFFGFIWLSQGVAAQTPSGTAPPAPAAPTQQVPPPRQSPLKISRAFIGETYVKVHYSAPSKRGRVIFGNEGALIPFGKVWRTGANEGTELTITKPLAIAGRILPAGTYTIFSIPNAGQWEIRFSRQVMLWDTGRIDPESKKFIPNQYDPSLDALAISVPAQSMETESEQFTLHVIGGANTGSLEIIWDKTKVIIPLSLPNP